MLELKRASKMIAETAEIPGAAAAGAAARLILKQSRRAAPAPRARGGD
eukprot:SAG31_NODE_2438_length_5695_cov_2.851501_3_plen_48_part_00